MTSIVRDLVRNIISSPLKVSLNLKIPNRRISKNIRIVYLYCYLNSLPNMFLSDIELNVYYFR